jgi:hypothetical protein
MEKNNNSQLELFTQSRQYLDHRDMGSSFLNNLMVHEKTVLIIIAIAIPSIISFSLGVEKGRRTTQANINARLDLAKTDAPKPQPENNIAEETRVKEYIRSYTIQLASYKTKSLAQREAQSLKKNGLSPLVLLKGGYTILCVGNFSNKEAAQPLLSQFKKRYQDCYIRRL